MRVISQDGKFDIPYAEIVVEIFCEQVVGRLKEYIGRDIILGSYSTESKSQKVMEMLRNTYQYAEECKCTGIGASQPEFVFRFPAESEVTADET